MKSVKDNLPKIYPAMVIALALLVSFCSLAVSAPSKDRERYQEGSISADFQVSSTLRARVDFWKDIFTRYGSAQMVVHHRDFPQIVFGVIDLSKEKAEMSKRMFEKHRSKVSKSTVKEIGEQLEELARGGRAKSAFQSRVLEELKQRKLSVSILSRWVKDDLIRTQTGIKERYAEAVQRAWRYMPSMEQIFVKEFGLPKELTRLPFIESSFDYTAHSSVGAAGIWQFMPRTARVYKMAVGRYVDERRDPIKATRAAAKYLQTAYKALGSWPLAIISYNHGVGGVRSKLKKAGNRDLESIIEDPTERFFGFASTNFYPEFLAAVEVYNNHRIYFPDVKQIRPLEVVSYRIPRAVSARTVAQNLGIATEELREANYGLLEPVWRGKAYIPAGYTFHIPAKYKERGDAVLPNLKVKRSTNTKTQIIPVSGSIAQNGFYRVRRGDSLSAIARRYGTTVSALRKRNGLKSSRIYSGQKLRVVNTSAKTSKERYRKVKVRRGDSLGKLSKRYGVTVRRIQEVNALSSNLIRIGEVIKIPYR